MRFRTDPGDCLICGAAHCACGATGPITITQLPQRDAAVATLLGDGSDGQPFSTETYRGPKKTKR